MTKGRGLLRQSSAHTSSSKRRLANFCKASQCDLPCDSQVLLDGQPLTHSDFDGYTLKDSRHLAIVGKACDLLKSGGRQLSVRISCG